MSVLAIIPARGNSKRLPRKNLKLFNGVPLVVRAIRCAKEAGIFDEILTSSEDKEILDIARAEGSRTQRRLPILSDDEVQTAVVALWGLAYFDLEHDAFCVLNPSSPLRTPEQLRHAWHIFNKPGFETDCLASGRLNGHDGDFLFWRTPPFLRYISRSCIPPDADWMLGSGVDINTEEDFQRAESLSSRS